MTRLFLDIETRSCCDLRKAGQYVYAEHPSTEITMLAWAIDDEPLQVWLPPTSTWSAADTEALAERVAREFSDGAMTKLYPTPTPPRGWLTGGAMPARLRAALEDPNVVIVAHNASFERILMGHEPGRRIGIPMEAIAPLSRWDCTAARAACVGLPRGLDGVAAALALDHQKDKDGARLMLQMCKPKPKTGLGGVPPQWWDDDDRLIREAVYCLRDVPPEREITKVLPPLSPEERRTWELTERMNDRGVPIDTALGSRLAFLVQDAEIKLNERLSIATGGAVKRVTDHMALTRWLDNKGVPVDDGVNKAAIRAMIEGLDAEEGLSGPDTDRDLIREVLIMRQEGGKSSAAKYRALLLRLSKDGRIRGALVYCGAAATGRWSSRGVQLQNLPRGGTLPDVDAALADVLGDTPLDMIEFLHGPGLIVASELLRPVFTAGE